MDFCLCSFETNNGIDEKIIDEKILKDAAFNSKIKDGQIIRYNYILIPISQMSEKERLANKNLVECVKKMFKKITDSTTQTIDSIASFLKEKLPVKEVEQLSISIDVNLKESSTEKTDIFYSDGSFRKADNVASYGVCRLLEQSENGGFDCFTGELRNSERLSGTIQNGTNNVGELTGVKIAIENFGERDVQVIISDSQYSIKCFREWMYNWKKNNYKAYSGKEILNKDLIVEINELLRDSKKIVLFKWTKGHATDFFNNVCDYLAKEALGLN